MKLTISLDMDNAAFEEDPGVEASLAVQYGILRLPQPLQAGDMTPLFDTNGNRVGEIEVTA